MDALAEAGHEARPVFVDRDVDVSLRQGRFDVGFVATRGRYASDGCLQGLLEMLGIAYTGSGVFASALAMNQAKCKDVLRLHNLPTAPAYVIRADAVSERSVLDHHGSFGFPVVVSAAGAGIGPGVVAGQRRAGAGGRGRRGLPLRRRGPGRAPGRRPGGLGGGAGRHAAGRPGSRIAGGLLNGSRPERGEPAVEPSAPMPRRDG